jgi:hypothetical protein
VANCCHCPEAKLEEYHTSPSMVTTTTLCPVPSMETDLIRLWGIEDLYHGPEAEEFEYISS